MAPRVTVREVREDDRPWLAEVAATMWASPRMVSRGRLTEDVSSLDGYVAELDGERAGLALVRVERDELELVALASIVERRGVGGALLEAVEAEAARRRVRRAWAVTTNDNVTALRFYQRRGWELTKLHRDAVTDARRLKPEITAVGDDGIPIRHELEFEAPPRGGARPP
jgi:GNAT superfamily N-acetyltransferase